MFDMSDGFPSLLESFSRIKCPTLVWSYITTLFVSWFLSQVLGAKSDILFPITQQREIAHVLEQSGRNKTCFAIYIRFFEIKGTNLSHSMK